MCLPNFFIVGAMKAATTTVYDLLRQHPDIFLPSLKEPHFFLYGIEKKTLLNTGQVGSLRQEASGHAMLG
jgi:hypothetical protein